MSIGQKIQKNKINIYKVIVKPKILLKTLNYYSGKVIKLSEDSKNSYKRARIKK